MPYADSENQPARRRFLLQRPRNQTPWRSRSFAEVQHLGGRMVFLEATARLGVQPVISRPKFAIAGEGTRTLDIQLGRLQAVVALLEQQPELVDQVWPRLLRVCNEAPLLRERILRVLRKHHPDLAKALEPVEGMAGIYSSLATGSSFRAARRTRFGGTTARARPRRSRSQMW